MNEKDWTLLTALAAERNLTRAAQRLYVTQPAVTRRIQQIEQELNCAIVVRGARGVELSAEGEALARYAAEELQRLRELREYIDNHGADVRGMIRLPAGDSQRILRPLPRRGRPRRHRTQRRSGAPPERG